MILSLCTMSTISLDPFLHHFRLRPNYTKAQSLPVYYRNGPPVSVSYTSRRISQRSFCNYRHTLSRQIRAGGADTAVVERSDNADVEFKETFKLKRSRKTEGKISIRLDNGKEKESWQLTVGCNLPGKWILHWGVNYVDDLSSDWDQPPVEMRPPGSVPIKDYAIETPMRKSSAAVEGDVYYDVKIDFTSDKQIAAINFVLKDEETGSWYQHRGRDFKVALIDQLQEDGNVVGSKTGSNLWPGALGNVSSILFKSEGNLAKDEDNSNSTNQQKKRLEGFYEEQSIVKEVLEDTLVSVSVKNCPETKNCQVYIETDIPGDVVVHWGVCKDGSKEWAIPDEPYPDETIVFKNKALRTLLKKKEGEPGSCSLFTLNEGFVGLTFVLKINENTWLNNNGKDFHVPLSSLTSSRIQTEKSEDVAYTDDIINEIRNLVSDISSEKSRKTKTKEAQENILQEIEKLAAEAYSIFRSSIPTFSADMVLEPEELKTPVKISSGTGSGFEILCQGFNWESHKSGRWYMELQEKAAELSSIGFTVVWLPPPTDSVSPEGYMPRDLYNLNSRYGNFDQLKLLVKKYHEVGIKVLGDVVLNHRCAQHKNSNGVWNIFGGRLNWDDQAVVADDPHFQGRGNKSSGDNFHAAPNIDHSQDFVRKDLKEWLCWLREEVGYDGWRLDFARGFWGGYVKDYMSASEPYFAVGEYWDSLSYSYGDMDHNQDAHRQRIVDWINATSGLAGAFDVTTKGILHTALKKCEYWRLSDQKGKPPGVVGWWPSRAVTFIENHDTGSTQGHWRFPGGKEMQGYAYILTHPGTPAVFYDHIFSHMRSEISSLISLRNRNKIQCRSVVKITKAERDVYAAVIDEKVAMKIGPGHYEPPSGSQKWSLALKGNDYKVWETVS